MPALTVIEATDDLTHVALAGRLDVQSATELESALGRHVTARELPALVDMSAVEVLASIAIGLLVMCSRDLERQGRKLVIYSCLPLVERALRAASIDLVVAIAADRGEAEKILAADEARD